MEQRARGAQERRSDILGASRGVGPETAFRLRTSCAHPVGNRIAAGRPADIRFVRRRNNHRYTRTAFFEWHFYAGLKHPPFRSFELEMNVFGFVWIAVAILGLMIAYAGAWRIYRRAWDERATFELDREVARDELRARAVPRLERRRRSQRKAGAHRLTVAGRRSTFGR